MSPRQMKKSPCAVPGLPRASEMTPSVCVRPVSEVGSCLQPGRARELSPPWMRPISGVTCMAR